MVKDVGWKGFLSDDARYADVINGIGCNGDYEKEGGVDMCKALTELIEDGKQEGREEGILLTKKVFKLYSQGKSSEEIAKMCNISTGQVEEILE